jgi:tetratricopeptide (TPR) repeat protein
MYEKAGDLSSARDRYEALARSVPPAEDSGAAAYKEADMDIARGDPRLGWREMGAMLFRFPNDGLGKSALHRILRHEDETDGPLATLAFLRENASRLESTERAEEVAYEIASRLEELGKLEEARDDFVHMAARWRYPVGALWDDALYRAAVIDERLGRPKSALADLDALLSQQETSILSGSYTRPRYPQAAMFAARIWRDDLHDAATARQMFHAAYANFPSWGERDQALWSEAELWSAEHRSDEECATLSALTRQFPDSRYVPCAALRCSNVKRAPASRAPTSCHPYIEVDKSSP